MFKTKLAAGLVALAVASGGVPANAHEVLMGNQTGAFIEIHGSGSGWEYNRGGLSYRELRRALRRQGYRLLDIVDRGRRTYTVTAENHRGRDFILRVSARSGAVLSVRPLRRWAGGYGPGQWGDDDRYRRDRERCWLPEGCD